jgi:hypothetical protein
LDNFDDRYLGAKTSDPTVDNDGDPLVVGALYYNSIEGEMRVYDGAQWLAASASQPAALVTFEYVATAGQTTFTGNDANGVALSYISGSVVVALNGVVLRPGDDYTATNGTSIMLASGALVGDELMVFAFASFVVANTYTKAEVDALAQTFTGISAPSTGWTGSGPYTNVITVTGLFATDSPIVDIDLSSVPYADVPDVQADWGLVYRVAATANNELTLYATDEPTENFTVQVKVVR